MSETVAELLERQAEDSSRIFLLLEDGTAVTYAEQLIRSRQVASALHGYGVKPGDRVHIALGNCREFFDIWFATAIVGAVLVPTDPRSSEEELGYVIEDSEPLLSIREPEAVDELRSSPRSRSKLSFRHWEPRSLVSILYTSGTTSFAKGVMVTNANYMAVGQAVANHLNLGTLDRWLIVLPLFHANAQYYCVMSAMARGASVAIPGRFSASRFGQQVRDFGATLGSLFAAPIRMILARDEAAFNEGESRLRAVLFGQNLRDSEAFEFERRYATRLLQLYGMTETVLPPTMNPNDDTRRWNSIGRVLPGVRIELIGDDDRPVAPGNVGEILVHGEVGFTLAAGYWRNSEATKATFTAKGLRTGDLARYDEEGFFYFVDRSKDMIKRGGENVSASEIERVVGEHPSVAECAAIGVSDNLLDEAIVIVVVNRPGHRVDDQEIIDWCARRMSAFKVPSYVMFAESLPRTSVGKVRKAELRRYFLDTR